MKKHLRAVVLGLAVIASGCGEDLPGQEESSEVGEVSQGVTVVGTSYLYGPVKICGFASVVSPNSGSIAASNSHAWRFVNTTSSTVNLRFRRWSDPPPSIAGGFTVSVAPGGFYDLIDSTSCSGTCGPAYFQLDGECGSTYEEAARIYYR